MKNKIRLPIHVKPERYKIMLKPDLNEFTFTGQETIYLSLEKSARQITLHAVELEIECDEAKVIYDKKTETVKLSFAKIIPAGKHQIGLRFKGILNDKMRGFYKSSYTHEEKVKYLATTQFESTDARRAFPCFDEPAQKAIFDVTLMIPSHMTAISNTIESNVLEHESGLKIVEFAPTPKMSTYLLAFILGEFEYVEREGVRVFTTPGKKEQAMFALDVAVKCLEFYNSYFGIKYPLPILDMIAIPDFAAGAMENWGAVTYRESTLLIDEAHSSSANKQWVALVIAHELAHMWFGNLVTMEWWTHLWLNEGFACFIEYLAVDRIFPEWDIWTQFVATEMADAFSLDALQNTHPIEVEVGHPAEISEIFDKVSYAKGASVLRMLWKYLGENDFQKGLQHYLKKHAYGNAKTEDLWKALEEVSGKPVASMMKNWTLKPGHPVVRVQGIGDRVQLTQSRFFSSPISKKASKDKTVWSIPITSLRALAKQSTKKIATSSATKVGTPRNDIVLMDKKTMTIPNTGEKLNLGETSLVRVAYPKGYFQPKADGSLAQNLSASDRLGLIRDFFDLAESGDSQTMVTLELVQGYTKEEDFTVWSEITAKLSKLDSLLAYESFYPEFQSFGRKIYKEIAEEMGWEKRKGERHTDGLLRGMVLYKLGSFGDDETIKKAQKLFKLSICHSGERSDSRIDSGQARMTEIRSIDPDLRGVVYNLVTKNGGQKEFNTLVSMYKDSDNQQEKDRLGRSLGLFQAKPILQKTLDFSISKNVRFQNTLGIIASVWSNPHGRYLAWEFVKLNWKLLKERYAGGHYFTRVFGPAGEFTKIVDAEDIEKFVAKNPVPEAERTIAQVLEQIYSNADWLKRDKIDIMNFLKKYA